MSKWIPVQKQSSSLGRWVDLDSGVIVSVVREYGKSATLLRHRTSDHLEVRVQVPGRETYETCQWEWPDDAAGRAELNKWLQDWLGAHIELVQ